MSIPAPPDDLTTPGSAPSGGNSPINFRRVLARALRFWYIIILSLAGALAGAYVFNRYATRIFPVTASIIIKENEENLGAKFLYNNELVNPYRNHYNEIFIMKSYPLLQEVVEQLHFDVAIFREGDIKTTEQYDADFPVKFYRVSGAAGKPFYFTARSGDRFEVSYPGLDDDPAKSNQFHDLAYGDTLAVNGYRLVVAKRGDVGPIQDQRFKVLFQDPFRLAQSYSNRLKLSWAQQGASVVDLEVQGPVAHKEIDFLKKFIERYQAYDVEKKTRESKLAIGFLDRQLLVTGDSLRQYESQVEAFKRKNITTNLKGETERLYARLLSFEEQKFKYQLTENYNQYVSELLKNDQYEGIFTPASVGVDDPVLAELITKLLEEQEQVNLYRSNQKKGADLTQDNPTLVNKLNRIQFIKQDILKAIANARVTRQINQRFMDQQIGLVEKQLQSLPTTERELIDIQRNYALKETLYLFLLQKRAEAGLSEASTTSDIVVVNPPVAGAAITPKPLQNYGIALGLGLLLPLLGFVLAEMLNNKIQSREDIEQVTNLTVLGGIGHNPVTDPLVVLTKPKSGLAESFRALRSNLNYYTGKKDRQVFLVTSSIPGEGKSFTSLNLASVFALSGKRTLVIGADLRRPKLFEELNLRNEKGLSQYLSGMVTLDAIIQSSAITNLFLLPGGATPPNPSELLLKPEMKALMTQLQERFDVIILDTPPLGFVTDALVLAPLVDHVLYVVRQNFTPREALHALQDFVDHGQLPHASIVFNDLRRSGMGYGYDSYGYGYGYGYTYSSKKKNQGGGYYSE